MDRSCPPIPDCTGDCNRETRKGRIAFVSCPRMPAQESVLCAWAKDSQSQKGERWTDGRGPATSIALQYQVIFLVPAAGQSQALAEGVRILRVFRLIRVLKGGGMLQALPTIPQLLRSTATLQTYSFVCGSHDCSFPMIW